MEISALRGVKTCQVLTKAASGAIGGRQREAVWEEKGNSEFHSRHINIPLTPAGSITPRQRAYAFSAWNLK